MIVELERLAGEIRDEKLRRKVLEFLKVPDIEFTGERLSLEECPGGAYIHHAYEGGLLQHTVAVVNIALTMCDLVEKVYDGEVDRDTVIAGALLHDVMKCYAYTYDGVGRFITSHIGERLDHLTLLVAEMYKCGFPLDVIHVVAAHHGEQSPVQPKTLEALIVSIADLTDSELSRQTLRAAEYIIRKTTGGRRRFSSSKEVLDLIRVKSKEGWEGVYRFNLEKE